MTSLGIWIGIVMIVTGISIIITALIIAERLLLMRARERASSNGVASSTRR